MAAAATLAEHFTFRVGHVDDVEAIAANNIAMAKVSDTMGSSDSSTAACNKAAAVQQLHKPSIP
jgi:hypothetical protein